MSTWETLSAWGFTPEARPVDQIPDIPEDITDLTDHRLMELFGQYTAWTAYAAHRKAGAERAQRSAEQHLRYVTALASTRAVGERTVAGRKAAALADPEVQAAETEVADAADMAEAMAIVYENTRLKTQLISRELSRRIAQEPHENRSAKWGV
ncbi:hypothetical protein [Saccharothrix sp. ST-888]|uniref:hypothetical protein n=1 Tax=Saccharothrix sp. ST-888 TaxID=1427391 RepID=UPI0005EC7DFF|nr:hypothetical protein [Saccharothrix sp. ST-888]KJK56224.1 hypothetical protein UK12_23865 [Saccharothrix sp. ST-888]